MADSKTLYTSPAQYWTEANPLGNGRIGAMVFGGISSDRVALNEETLISGFPHYFEHPKALEVFEQIKNYVADRQYEEAQELASYGFLFGNTELYMPAGDMFIDYDIDGDVKNYTRTLDMSKAIVTVDFTANDIKYKKEYFVSYPDNVMVVKLSASGNVLPDIKVRFASRLKSECASENGMLYLEGECPGKSGSYSSIGKVRFEYFDEPEKRGVRFKSGAKAICDGTITFEDGVLDIKGASEAVIIMSIKTSYNGYDRHPFTDGKEYRNALEQTLNTALELGYEELLRRHLDDYIPLFERIKLDLGESGREDMPTDERLTKFAEDKNDISLYTLLFDFGRYLTIAGSRAGTQAMNLTGIWNQEIIAPWRGNYTLNINTEMNYWPTLMCGLDECFEPLIEFVKTRSVPGARTAREYYGASGFVIHHNSDLWAHTTPVSFDAQYGFWHGASGWLTCMLYDYFEYTQDKDILAQTIYPLMKEAAKFYLDLLWEREDGKLSVFPATSPENRFRTERNNRCSVAKYTTMSDSIAFELFEKCKAAIAAVGDDDAEFVSKIDRALENMNPFAIGTDGRLLEWNEEFGDDEVNHRHVSHLYALHPAHLITPEHTPELAEACKRSLEKRGDAGTGWSLAWKINFWARLNDGNHALKLLDMQLTPKVETDESRGGGTYPNLFDAHPPFQIDGNFGAPSGILEMLVDVRNGELKLLPALPDKWKNGSLKGVRIRGGKILDIEWADGKLVSCIER